MVSEFNTDIKGFGWFVGRERKRLYGIPTFAVSSTEFIFKLVGMIKGVI